MKATPKHKQTIPSCIHTHTPLGTDIHRHTHTHAHTNIHMLTH